MWDDFEGRCPPGGYEEREVSILSPEPQVQQHLRELALAGHTVIRGVVPPSEVGSVQKSVLATVERVAGFNDSGVGFLAGVLNHDQSIVPYLTESRLMGAVRGALGKGVHISFASAIINAPRNARGGWHADWPFNQRNAGAIPAPQPDVVMHLTTLWMLTPFSTATGGTLVVPGSHRYGSNPTGDNGFDATSVVAGEMNAHGDAGDVLLFDSRLWHATAQNSTDEPRVALAVRYAPWWLDTTILHPGSEKRRQLVEETGVKENEVPRLDPTVHAGLPAELQDLLRHAVARS